VDIFSGAARKENFRWKFLAQSQPAGLVVQWPNLHFISVGKCVKRSPSATSGGAVYSIGGWVFCLNFYFLIYYSLLF
jgi:hypothetical protein